MNPFKLPGSGCSLPGRAGGLCRVGEEETADIVLLEKVKVCNGQDRVLVNCLVLQSTKAISLLSSLSRSPRLSFCRLPVA